MPTAPALACPRLSCRTRSLPMLARGASTCPTATTSATISRTSTWGRALSTVRTPCPMLRTSPTTTLKTSAVAERRPPLRQRPTSSTSGRTLRAMTAICSVHPTSSVLVYTLPSTVTVRASTARRSSTASPVARRTCRASTRPVIPPRPTASTVRPSTPTTRTTCPALPDPVMSSAPTPGRRRLAPSPAPLCLWMSPLCPPRTAPRLPPPLLLLPLTTSPRLTPTRPSPTHRLPSMQPRRLSMTTSRR